MSSESPTSKSKAMPMLYHKENSTRLFYSSSPIVQALIELGIKDDKVTVKTITDEEQKAEAFLALNASGQIPVYVDETGKTVAESISIMMRILDDFDTEHKLMPATGDFRRYVCIEAMCMAATSLYPALAGLSSESEEIKKEARKLCDGKLTVAVEAMLKRFDGPYVLGDQVSAADFFLAYNLFGMKYMKSGEPAMMTDAIAAYVATMEKLPSAREVYELDAEKPAAAEAEKAATEEATDTKMEETEKTAVVEEEKAAVVVEETDTKAMEVEADKNPAEEVTASKGDAVAADSKALEVSTPADEVIAAVTTA